MVKVVECQRNKQAVSKSLLTLVVPFAISLSLTLIVSYTVSVFFVFQYFSSWDSLVWKKRSDCQCRMNLGALETHNSIKITVANWPCRSLLARIRTL